MIAHIDDIKVIIVKFLSLVRKFVGNEMLHLLRIPHLLRVNNKLLSWLITANSCRTLCCARSLIFVGMTPIVVVYCAESAYKIEKIQSSGVLLRLYL